MTAMRRLSVLVLALALMGLLLAACGGDDDGGAVQTPSTTAASSGSSGGGGATVGVTIKNFAFTVVSVKAGSTVTVKNDDGTTHTVTADDKSFDAGEIPGGATKTFTAPDKPGDYKFHCHIHPSMTGTLTVT